MNTNTNQYINMGNINRDNKGEAYYEFSYSPVLPKRLQKPSHSDQNESSLSNLVLFLKKWFCCGGMNINEK